MLIGRDLIITRVKDKYLTKVICGQVSDGWSYDCTCWYEGMSRDGSMCQVCPWDVLESEQRVLFALVMPEIRPTHSTVLVLASEQHYICFKVSVLTFWCTFALFLSYILDNDQE